MWVEGDPIRLEQIISNLLENAAKYTEPGGRIELTLREEHGEAPLSVRDTGIGLAPETVESIFELFTQLRRSIANLVEIARDIRRWALKDQVVRLNQVLRGHNAYYGLAGTWRSIHRVDRFVERCWHKMLRSRSWAARITREVYCETYFRYSAQRSP